LSNLATAFSKDTVSEAPVLLPRCRSVDPVLMRNYLLTQTIAK
jgi:hypothetical protein